jgi:intracellular sulfur oxidation DsrE/DsrF family protein
VQVLDSSELDKSARAAPQSGPPLLLSVIPQQNRPTTQRRKSVANITRRSFLSVAPAGLATLGALAGTAQPADPQLVWRTSDWKISEFRALTEEQAQIKQLFDITQIAGGGFLNNIKNSLNGLHFGFGIPSKQTKIIAALHGPANMLNYDDCVWSKYQVGAWLNITDPATGNFAVKNIFYHSKNTQSKQAASKDPNDPGSIYQDTSVEALQSRGVQFLACHTATEEQAQVLVRRNNLTQSPESVADDMLAHAVPGVLVVASMVSAIALLQAKGRYTYITV